MRGCMFPAPVAAGRAGELLLGLGAQPLPVGEELLVEQREQQVLRVDLGLPRRRASSCAAATASWLLTVSLLKSIAQLTSLDRSLHFRHGAWHRPNPGSGDWVSGQLASTVP